jgi:hypothetical protein
VNQDTPELYPGTIGANRESGFLDFPWAQGHFKLVRPTIGPLYKEEDIFHPRDWYASALFHLHLAKRGFGTPTKKIMIEALEKHKLNLTQKFDIPEEITRRAFEFGKQWAEDCGVKRAVSRIHLSHSSGACLESTRANGGRNEWVRSNLDWITKDKTLTLSIPAVNVFTCWGDIAFTPDVIRLYGKRQFDYSSVKKTSGSLVRGILSRQFSKVLQEQSTETLPKFSGVLNQVGIPVEGRAYHSGVTASKEDFHLIDFRYRYAHRLPYPTNLPLVLFDFIIDELWSKGDGRLLFQNVPKPSIGNSPFTGVFYEPPGEWFTSLPKFRVDKAMIPPTTDESGTVSIDTEDYLHYKAVAVEDRGCKARVITVGSALEGTIGHFTRTYLMGLCEKDPECVLVDGGSHVQILFRKMKNLPKDSLALLDKIFLNLDLSAATDTFDSGLARALAFGAIEALRKSYMHIYLRLRSMADSIAKDCEIHYNVSRKLRVTYVKRRAILMGTPESWAILNLYNKYLLKIADAMATNDFNDLLSVDSLDHPIVLESLRRTRNTDDICVRCGDDFAGVLYAKTVHCYILLLKLTGAKPSPGTNTLSKQFCIFTETLSWVPKPFQSNSMEWVDILKIIGLVDAKGLNRMPSRKEVPRKFFRGLAYYLALRWWKGDPWRDAVRKGLTIFGQYLLHDFIKACERLGLEPFLPNVFGGLNLPHPRGKELRHVKTRTLRAVAYTLRDDCSVECFFERNRLNVWDFTMANRFRPVQVELQRLVCSVLTSEVKARTEEDLHDESKIWFDRNLLFNFAKKELGKPLELPKTRIIPFLKNWADSHGFYTLKEFWGEICGSARGIAVWFLSPPEMEDDITTYSVAKRFNLAVKQLNGQYVGPFVRKRWEIDLDELQLRSDFADVSTFVRRSLVPRLTIRLNEDQGLFVG